MSIGEAVPPEATAVDVPLPHAPQASGGPSLKDLDPLLASYRISSRWRSLWQLTTTLTLFFVSWTLAYLSLSVSWWLSAALAFPTAMLIIRLWLLWERVRSVAQTLDLSAQ